MKLSEFPHIKFTTNVNKKKIPIVEIPYSNYQLWNKLYLYAKRNCIEVQPTTSQGLPNGRYKGHFRYMVTHINQSHELVMVVSSGCYRFIVQPSKLKTNTVSGRKSVIELFKVMDEHNIDFSKYSCENGQKVKLEIEKPLIQEEHKCYLNKVFNHMYHLDLNSSYASRIVEAYPELRQVYEELYHKRKDNDGKYKHVLTNSIGCFQSPYCPDWSCRRKSKPYSFANLSKIAINGTRKKILDIKNKLINKGMLPILTNTDGIWYYSSKGPYHDKEEGTNLCQWKNDHIDCKFLMVSRGAYQYIENGVCKTILRGSTNLDKVKERDDWEFGDIVNATKILNYEFDEEKGVVQYYE